MKPGNSTSHVAVAVRWAIEASPAAAAAMAPPSNTRIATLPINRPVTKATTNEKMGFIGRCEGIAAMAVASVDLPE